MPVALGALGAVVALFLWIILQADQAMAALTLGKEFTLSFFHSWFIYAISGFVGLCLCVAALPACGRIRLGADGERPEHSTPAWLSMILCAGIGAGALIYSVSEPLSHLALNPSVINGSVEANSHANATLALSYTYLHWGLSAWACYTVLGLAIAYFGYRRRMPLTIRTALSPLLGRSYDGPLGDAIDVISILAIIMGIATTLGYGVRQFVFGVNVIAASSTPSSPPSMPDPLWQLAALALAGAIATTSALMGGIKVLSVLGAWLFAAVLIGFSFVGDLAAALERLAVSVWTYIASLPRNATHVAVADGTERAQVMAAWQIDWTIFYWAWWIAFAPFVALFLARVSRGRSLRAFILGCMIAPVGVCAIWFSFVGGTALDIQLDPAAGIDLQRVATGAQIYETIREIATPGIARFWSAIYAALLMLLLITTLNAGILAINAIAAAGCETRCVPHHIIVWGAAVTAMIGSLIIAGGTEAIRNAMIIGALPFSFVIALAGVCVAVSLARELRRTRA
ncbi:MAG: BCCT family transporter [Pseudomonadota bacterium]